MNNDILQGKWNEIKGEIRSQWGKLTEDELETSSGNLTSIAGLIQQRYGAKKEDIQDGLNRILSKFNAKAEDFKNDLREDKTRH